jgi:riboflavin biosynthesis pyrimidine reductase
LFATLRSLADVVLVGAAEVADVIITGDDNVDLARAVSALAKQGNTNVLSESGPGIAAQLAAADLLDEVCLTVAPLLAVGEARRILDGVALAPPSVLELGHMLEADGYLFLRYRRR